MSVLAEPPPRRVADEEERRRDGERMLARYAVSRDPHLRDALVERYMPLARRLALRYRNTSEPLDDLMQVAAMGLIKAIDRFEPGRGTAFSSFAVPTILGELRRHLRDHSWTVRVPRDTQELAQRLDKASDRLAADLGRAPTVKELAAELGTSEEQLLDAHQARHAHSPASLEAPVGSEDGLLVLADVLGADDDRLERAEAAVLVDHYLDALPPRSRAILRLRFQQELMQREIGDLMGLSQMHVSRLIRQSLEDLQRLAAAEAREVP
jgi:RNA polymerase sigma-B factor